MKRVVLFLITGCFCLHASVKVCSASAHQDSKSPASQTKLEDPKDGPHVFWRSPSTVEIITYCDGVARREIRENVTKPFAIPVGCDQALEVLVDPTPPKVPASSYPSPSRVLAVSDLEGNYDTFVKFLKGNGVIDESGRWSWGDGHLVFNGDIVDRGEHVTELMWLIRKLEQEAAEVGGGVHYILGNHETMVMGGDLRYIHPKYAITTPKFGTTYENLYSQDSEIGRWWRTRNSVEKIGDTLFVHAGYSPELNRLGFSLDQLNGMIRAGLGPPAWPARDELRTQPIWHMNGPLWYRGYFPQYAPSWGGSPSTDEITQILTRHGVKRIVVGHTVVDDVQWLDTEHSLMGIDVKWSDPAEGEGLFIENGQLHRVDMSGTRRPIEDAPFLREAPTQAK